jgi:hypothetical protein
MAGEGEVGTISLCQDCFTQQAEKWKNSVMLWVI